MKCVKYPNTLSVDFYALKEKLHTVEVTKPAKRLSHR